MFPLGAARPWKDESFSLPFAMDRCEWPFPRQWFNSLTQPGMLKIKAQHGLAAPNDGAEGTEHGKALTSNTELNNG